jgi:3-phosphoshikimate 1-carboxyvinyltransferase
MGQSIISNVVLSEDILATITGVQAFGAEVIFDNNRLIINGGKFLSKDSLEINCRESGSTLRFLIPLGLLTNNCITYIGKGNLSTRPLDPYLEIFKEQGIFHSNNTLPMCINGKLKPGIFKLKGNISSQFITGLLFALPLLEANSTIQITEPLESRAYIDLTIETLESFGILIENHDYNSFFIKGNQSYKPTKYTVEGDYSQAAFWLAAGALGGDVACLELMQNSKQGDRAIIDILTMAGTKFIQNEISIKAYSSNLHAFNVDVSQCPDIAPILAVIAALSRGTSKITGAARLRIKECDRLKAIALELRKLGAEIIEEKDSLTIEGKDYLLGGEADSWGDHRIAMALTIAAAQCVNPVILHNCSVVDKSYPNFYEDYKILGGCFNEWNLGQ